MHLTRLSPEPLFKEITVLRTLTTMLSNFGKKRTPTMKSFRTRRRATSTAERLADSLTICNLFRYASLKDKLYAVVGLLSAIVAGAVTPIALIFMSNMIDNFVFHHLITNNISSELPWRGHPEDLMFLDFDSGTFWDRATFSICCLAGCVLALFVLNGLLEIFLSQAGAKQSFRIRLIFMESILHQEQKWIQANVNDDFVQKRLDDLDRIEEGLGSKLGLFVSNSCTLIFCTLSAFATNWRLFLLMLIPLPIFLIIITLIGQRVSFHQRKEGNQLQIAAFTASEAIHNIRAVVAFGAEDKEVLKFRRRLDYSQRHAYRKLVWLSLSSSLIWVFLYICYAIAFWYGVCDQLMDLDESGRSDMRPSHILCPIFNLALALLSAAKLVTYGGVFRKARSAAKEIFSLADIVGLASEETGEVQTQCEGHVVFDSVSSAHSPTPLKTLSIEIENKQRLSILDISWEKGQPHSIADLLVRFSDPSFGKIVIDGKDIRSYNLGWLRSHIAIVRQDPVLFSTTIADNIRYGNPMIQQNDIEHAAIAAQAHKFILKLPNKYETVLSSCGAPLSLGQRQLLCIARAIARNASVLVLENPGHNLRGDAAAMVINAMENAMEGRTAIFLSNKAYKLRDHKRIIVLDEGKIVEEGSYSELVNNKKVFAQHLKKELRDMKELGVSPLGEVLLPASGILDRQVSSLMEQDATTDHNEGFNQQAHSETKYSNRQLMSLLREHIPTVSVGCIFAALSGVSLSLYGVIFGDMLYSFILQKDPKLDDHVEAQCTHLVILGVVTTIVAFFHSWAFTLVGERVGSNLLKTAYESILRQPISWFDNPKNEVTDVIRIVLNDVSQVKFLIGPLLTLMFQGISSLVCWVALASYFYWRLGVCALSFAPAILLAVFFEHYVLGSHSKRNHDDRSRRLAIDIINKLSTVKCLHQEQIFCASYAVAVTGDHNTGITHSLRNGLLYAVSQAVPLLSYTVILYVACSSIEKNLLHDFTEVFKLTESIIFGVLLLAQSLAVFAPNFSQARRGAAFVFGLRKSLNNFSSNRKFDDDNKDSCYGFVSFRDVHFRYSSCTYIFTQDQLVLNGISFEATPGQMVALAGEIGSGKRACLELLQGFNKPTGGEILLDNKSLVNLDVTWLRRQMGIINLEPHFFYDTIWANVAYGRSCSQVTNEMVFKACRQSKIHDFILKLPQGYQTLIGLSESHSEVIGPAEKVLLSIARALLREPTILLIDQAGWEDLPDDKLQTIIDVLEEVRKESTCILISPTQKAAEKCSNIWLLQQGRVVDKGKHQELLTRRPRYKRLFKQLRSTKVEGDSFYSRSNSLLSERSLASISSSVVTSQTPSRVPSLSSTPQRRNSSRPTLDFLDATELASRLRTIETASKDSNALSQRDHFDPQIADEALPKALTIDHKSETAHIEIKNTTQQPLQHKLKIKPPPIVIPKDTDPSLHSSGGSSDEEAATPETPRKRIDTIVTKIHKIIEDSKNVEASSESEDEHQLTVKGKLRRKSTQPSDIIKRLSQKKLDRELQGKRTEGTEGQTGKDC